MPKRVEFWWRVAAMVIDWIIILPVAFVVGSIVFPAIESASGNANFAENITTGINGTIWLSYSLLEVIFAATAGKLLLGMRITRGDGGPGDNWRLFLRWSTKQSPWILSTLFHFTGFPGFYVIGGFCALIVVIGCLFASNDDKLAWHDQWAGTAVVFRRSVKIGHAVHPDPTM